MGKRGSGRRKTMNVHRQLHFVNAVGKRSQRGPHVDREGRGWETTVAWTPDDMKGRKGKYTHKTTDTLSNLGSSKSRFFIYGFRGING